ncbi:MAG: formate dehydrogenase subunit alpha [Planctomycetes bacterium]|nr:formate dehydrogenase subunit alpha [Planctomycetota bacterium]
MNPTDAFMLNGRPVAFTTGETILQVAKRVGTRIPTLCSDERVEPTGACRTCLVEVQGWARLAPACKTQPAPGMVVNTEGKRIARHRRGLLALYLSDHPAPHEEVSGPDSEVYHLAREFQAPDDWPKLQSRRVAYAGNPFIAFRADRCISCSLCTRYCEQVEGVSAIAITGRGGETSVSTPDGRPLRETTCEFCGGCVAVCPTGALADLVPLQAQAPSDGQLDRVRTTCNYCGVGCQLDLLVESEAQDGRGRVWKAAHPPAGTHPNDGNLCVKGKFAHEFIHHPDRLTQPMIRGQDGALRPVDWPEALRFVVDGLRAVQRRHGSGSLGFVSSARCTNEENYLMQKLARACFGTNNLHQCAGLCHDPTVAGLAMTLGAGAMTNSIADIRHADFLFVIGSNTTEAHPVIGMEMKRAIRQGARLVVADPRDIWLTRVAHRHLRLKPGTDVWLLNAMAHVLVFENLYDREFVRRATEGFEELKTHLQSYDPVRAEAVTGVPADEIRATAREYAQTRRSGIYYTLGITEHTTGVDNVCALSNLALLTGHLGYPSTGVNPLRGQNNVQGANDSGASPDYFPGYQPVEHAEVRAKFEAAWGVALPAQVGENLNQMMRHLGGSIRGMYLMGEDPVMSEPDLARLEEGLNALEFLVVQDIFMSETARFAHVILPGACFAEKEGTFTNTERRVQRVRQAVKPPGVARADWEILIEVARAAGSPWSLRSAADVFDEMAALSPRFAGIHHTRLDREGGLCWPCPTPDHPGTAYLHAAGPLRGKGLLKPITFRPPAETATSAYPLVLSTGRTLFHYNADSQTGRAAGIRSIQPENFVQIHPLDAAHRGIDDGEQVEVTSNRGAIRTCALVTDEVQRGCVWMPFHFVESKANRLTVPEGDAVTGTPEYKVCAVEVRKCSTST